MEELVRLGAQAGLLMTYVAFSVDHPSVTSAINNPPTTVQLDTLLPNADTVVHDAVPDRIDEIVPPGADFGPVDVSSVPPAVAHTVLRGRPRAARRRPDRATR